MAAEPQTQIEQQDEVLDLTQTVRLKMIRALTEHGVPTDSKSVRVLTELMSSADTTAVQVKKMGNDKDIADVNKQAAIVSATILAEHGTRNPFSKENVSEEKVIAHVEPEINVAELPELDLVPGETEQGSTDLNYDDFMKKAMAEIDAEDDVDF